MLRRACAGSSEPLLLDNVMSTEIARARSRSNGNLKVMCMNVIRSYVIVTMGFCLYVEILFHAIVNLYFWPK